MGWGGSVFLDASGLDLVSEDAITSVAGSVQGFFANDNNLLVPGDAGFRFRTSNASSNDIAVANFDPGVGLGVNMFVGQFDPNTQFTGDPGDFYFNMSPVDDDDVLWVKGPSGGFGTSVGWVPVQAGTSSPTTAWLINGNGGTDPNVNFVGTTDGQDLVLRTNNIEVARFGLANNFSFGYGAQALSSNMNVMGNDAGVGANNAQNSNFFGLNAGASAINASLSNFIGFYAGSNATNAATSNFIGASAGNGATNATESNFIGDSAGFNATDATFSNFIGYRAGFVSANASNSNFIGNEAGNGATDASNANFFGQMAGLGAVNAQASNFIGFRSGLNATDAYRSNFFGYFAGQGALNANNSNFFGESAGQDATNANNSNFFGTSAGQNAATADNSNFFGNGAGLGAVDAFNSNFFGQESGYLASNAPNSNFFGHSAGYQATNADASNFLGQDAGYQATNANHSNFFGTSAGQSATDASDANFFGQNAGNGASSAVGSNFFGPDAGSSATNASRSNFFGDSAGQNSVNASYSNFLGYRAGENAPNAANSIFIGRNAGLNDTVNNTISGTSILIGANTNTGGFSNSIALGASARNTATNEFVLGATTTVDSSINEIYLGRNSTNAFPLIYANLTGVGIGTTTPTEKLSVAGNIRFSGALMPNNLSGATGTVLMSQGAGLAPVWTGTSSLGLLNHWQKNTNVLSPNDAAVYQIAVTNNSASTLTGFKTTNTNDASNYAGAVLELKGSGADFTNNVYFGKYGASFYIPSWAGNGVLATDKSLVLGALGNSSSINFQVSGGYVAPVTKMTLSSTTLQLMSANFRLDGAFMPNNLAGATGTLLMSQGNGLAPVWIATSSLNLSVSSSNFGFIQNGNSFGTTATLGTNDAFNLQFETNNSVRMALTQAGRLTFTNVPGNVFLGGGNDATTGVGNVGIGMLTLASNTTGQNNVANGYAALAANTTGYNNTANGGAALTSNTTGYNNTANGILAMQFNISGTNNVANGASALRFNTGNNNVASGVQAGYNNTSGSDNVIMGMNSFMGNVTGSRNIAIGSSAMINNTSNNNTALGYQAGYSIASGSENTFIGYNTNTASETITNSTALGANVILAQSNTLILGNNVNVGIGTTTPSERLQVNGNFRLDGAFMPGNSAGLLGQILISQGSGLAPVWTATSSLNLSVSSSTIASNFGFIQNGNSFGTTATLGTNDNFDLTLETVNTPRITINTLGGVSVAGETGGGGAYTMNVAANTSSNALRITGSADTIYAQQGAGANVFFIRTAGANTHLTASAGNSLILGVGGTTQNDFNINSSGDTTVRHRLYVADSFSGSGVSRIGQTIQSATNSGNQTGATTQLLIQPDDGGLDSTGTNIGLNVNMGSLSGGTNYAAVFQNGNVGITTTAPLYLLHVGSASIVSGTTVARFENAGGTCDVTPNVAGGITCTSDQTLKKDIESIDPIDNLTKLLTVEIKSYRMNADTSTSTKQTGFLAQQLETQFPGLVLTSIEGTKSVSYAGMTPILTQAIQTLYKFMTDIGVTIEGGVAKVGEFFAKKVTTEELCVGNVCVTESQFLQMVQDIPGYSNATQTPSENSEDNTNTPADNTDPTTSEDISVDETSEQGESEQTGQSETLVSDTSSGADTQIDVSDGVVNTDESRAVLPVVETIVTESVLSEEISE